MGGNSIAANEAECKKMNEKNDDNTKAKPLDLSQVRKKKQIDEMNNRFAAQIDRMENRRLSINEDEFDNSLRMLLRHAHADHGGAKRCAMFLLSLWNGDSFKADLQELLYVDPDIFDAMLCVLKGLYNTNSQLDSHVADDAIKPIYEAWGEAFRSQSE